MGEVPLSKWLMNRRMRTRLYGGVGRAGEKPALTRLNEAAKRQKEPFTDTLHSVFFFEYDNWSLP